MSGFDELVAIVARLRGPDGCPWDKAQDPRSMRPYLLEETYEVLDAIEAGDPARLREELGDLLFNVVMLAQMAQDGGLFTVDDVPGAIAHKMVERHPHVFGADGSGGSIAEWEGRKAETGKGRLDGVPRTLPALLRAHRQGEKAAAVGFDWSDAQGVLAKVKEEIGELEAEIASGDTARIEQELGDLLMAVASLGRFLRTPPESALQLANDRFLERFRMMERLAAERAQSLGELGPEALDGLWEEAKRTLG
jgi:tetrapyrrole methylase family protein/MazG family protein